MFSVVCVYNDQEVLDNRLLKSLSAQTAKHEVITIDNRTGKFSNASSALNFGAKQATGDFLIFAHQDVSFLSKDWLSKAENLLQSHNVRGWAGVAGRSVTGGYKGFLIDYQHLYGTAFDGLEEVQTLDECVLIHRNNQQEFFDNDVPTWHAYGVEACCAAVKAGEKNYVLSLPTWHDSNMPSIKGLEESHYYVWEKYKAAIPKINTTCGILPDEYKWSSNLKKRASINERINYRVVKKLTDFALFNYGLEELTKSESFVECLHRVNADLEPIKVTSFIPESETKRPVVHRFEGLCFDELRNECVIVMPELTKWVLAEWKTVKKQINRIEKLFLCLNFTELTTRPLTAYEIKQSSKHHKFYVENDMKIIAVFQL